MPTDSGRAVARAPADKRATRGELVPGRATFWRDLNDRAVRPHYRTHVRNDTPVGRHCKRPPIPTLKGTGVGRENLLRSSARAPTRSLRTFCST